MVKYKDYLLNMICESDLEADDIDLLTEAVTNADSIEDLDAIEEVLTEAAKTKDLTLKEQQDASGATTAPDNGKNRFNQKDLQKALDAQEKYEKGLKMIEDGDIEKGAKICGEASKELYTILGKIAKQFRDSDDIEKTLQEFSDAIEEFDKKCKSGDVTASDAATLGKKILVKIKLAFNKVKSALSKLGTKATKESTLDMIAEAAADGYLTDDDLDFLSDALAD